LANVLWNILVNITKYAHSHTDKCQLIVKVYVESCMKNIENR